MTSGLVAMVGSGPDGSRLLKCGLQEAPNCRQTKYSVNSLLPNRKHLEWTGDFQVVYRSGSRRMLSGPWSVHFKVDASMLSTGEKRTIRLQDAIALKTIIDNTYVKRACRVVGTHHLDLACRVLTIEPGNPMN